MVVSTPEPFRDSKTYDLLAALPLSAWYLLVLSHVLLATKASLTVITAGTLDFLTLSTLLARVATVAFLFLWVVLLLVRRRPLARAKGIYPRVAANAGSFLVVVVPLLPPSELPPSGYLVSALLTLGGTAFAIYAILRLGRSVSIMPEARRFVTAGPYGWIRHPLYLGEEIAVFGMLVQFFSPLALFIVVLQCCFQFERMRFEERVLVGTFPEYNAYMAQTSRLIPGVF